MTPRPEDTEEIITEAIQEDPVDDKETETGEKDPNDKPVVEEEPTPADEVEKSNGKDGIEDKGEEKEEETPVAVEESKPKTPDEIRNSFDPFFNASNDDAADKIAKESADAAKELASLFS